MAGRVCGPCGGCLTGSENQSPKSSCPPSQGTVEAGWGLAVTSARLALLDSGLQKWGLLAATEKSPRGVSRALQGAPDVAPGSREQGLLVQVPPAHWEGG